MINHLWLLNRDYKYTNASFLEEMKDVYKRQVGPRPPLPREVAQYSDWAWGRLAVKPGLTCYWQISGRSDVSFEEWMKLDLKYVEEQSFWTDMEILWKTVGVDVYKRQSRCSSLSPS